MTILTNIYNILFNNFYSIDYTNNSLTIDNYTDTNYVKIPIKFGNNMYNNYNASNSDIKIEYKNIISDEIKYNVGTYLLNKSFRKDTSTLNNILNDILTDNSNKNHIYIYDINRYCLEVLYNKYKYKYFQENKKEKFIYSYKNNIDNSNIDNSNIDDLYLQSLKLFFQDFTNVNNEKIDNEKIYNFYKDKDAIRTYIGNNKTTIDNTNINAIENVINNNTDLKQSYDNIINTDNNYLINKFKEEAFKKTFNSTIYLNNLLSFLNKNNKLEDFIKSDKDKYIEYVNFIINNIDDEQIKQNAFIDHFKLNDKNILYLYCLNLFLLNKNNKNIELNNYIDNYIKKIKNTTDINNLINNTENYIITHFKDDFNKIFINNINLDIKKKIMLNYFQSIPNSEEILKNVSNYIPTNEKYYNKDYYTHILFYMKDNNIDINVQNVNDYTNNLNNFEKLLYDNINYREYILSLNIEKKESLINYYQYYKKKLYNFCDTLPYDKNNKNKIIFNNLSIQNKKKAMLKGLSLTDSNNLNNYLEIYLSKQIIDIDKINEFISKQLEENYENIIYDYIHSNIYIDYLTNDIPTLDKSILNSIHLIQKNDYDAFCKKYDKKNLQQLNTNIISYVIQHNLLRDQTNQINSISLYIKDICNKYSTNNNIMTSTNLDKYINNMFTTNDILNTNIIFLYLKCFFKTNNIIKHISDNNIKNITELSEILLSYIFLLDDKNIDILYINDFIFSKYNGNYIFNYKDNIIKLFNDIFKYIQIKTFTNCKNNLLYKLNIIDLSYSIIYDITCNNCNTNDQCKILKDFIINEQDISKYNVFKNIFCDKCKENKIIVDITNMTVNITNIPNYLIFYNQNNIKLYNYLELKVFQYNFKLKYVITLNNKIYSLIEQFNNNDDNIHKYSVYLFYKLCKCDIGRQSCDC